MSSRRNEDTFSSRASPTNHLLGDLPSGASVSGEYPPVQIRLGSSRSNRQSARPAAPAPAAPAAASGSNAIGNSMSSLGSSQPSLLDLPPVHRGGGGAGVLPHSSLNSMSSNSLSLGGTHHAHRSSRRVAASHMSGGVHYQQHHHQTQPTFAQHRPSSPLSPHHLGAGIKLNAEGEHKTTRHHVSGSTHHAKPHQTSDPASTSTPLRCHPPQPLPLPSDTIHPTIQSTPSSCCSSLMNSPVRAGTSSFAKIFHSTRSGGSSGASSPRYPPPSPLRPAAERHSFTSSPATATPTLTPRPPLLPLTDDSSPRNRSNTNHHHPHHPHHNNNNLNVNGSHRELLENSLSLSSSPVVPDTMMHLGNFGPPKKRSVHIVWPPDVFNVSCTDDSELSFMVPARTEPTRTNTNDSIPDIDSLSRYNTPSATPNGTPVKSNNVSSVNGGAPKHTYNPFHGMELRSCLKRRPAVDLEDDNNTPGGSMISDLYDGNDEKKRTTQSAAPVTSPWASWMLTNSTKDLSQYV